MTQALPLYTEWRNERNNTSFMRWEYKGKRGTAAKVGDVNRNTRNLLMKVCNLSMKQMGLV